MTNRPLVLLFSAASFYLLTPTIALATEALVRPPYSLNSFNYNSPVTIGYAFRTPTIGTALPKVTALGVWDQGGNGLTSSVDVGLWTDTGELLRQVTVIAGQTAPLFDGFRYTSLGNTGPILKANTIYVLGAFRRPGVPYSAAQTIEGIHFGVSPGFDILIERASSDTGGISFPNLTNDSDQALVGPNIRFDLVPEPTSAYLVVLATLGMLRVRRTSRSARR